MFPSHISKSPKRRRSTNTKSSQSLPPLRLQQSNTSIFNQNLQLNEHKTIDPIELNPGFNLISPSASISACTPITPGIDGTLKFLQTENIEYKEDNKETDTLTQHGYTKIAIICSNSLQGEVFLAENTEKTKNKRVAIKKVNKQLYSQFIAMEDDMSFVVEEDIVKEAAILNILTVMNRAPGDYIVKGIEFFEDVRNYYLVTEYCGKTNLLKFVTKAHTLIKNNKLDIKIYQKAVKYLFWQICVIFNWLHNSMQCCHLDLCMDNIMVRNCTFIENENGMYTINPKISIKIIDFGCSELFQNDNWKCGKTTLTGNYVYCAPQVYDNILFDARKADVYQLGCILYHMSIGIPAYQYQDSRLDQAFLCIERNNIRHVLKHNNLLHYANKKLITLLNGMLHTSEKQRVHMKHVLQHVWFKNYFEKYQDRIYEASKQQKAANKSNSIVMKNFPYYTIENNY